MKIKWTARIAALAILIVGLPFYFGYGNPLPFIDPEYTAHTNLWTSIFPLVFIGLAVGWFKPRIGGYLITIPLIIGFISPLIIEGGFGLHMLIPFAVGILYLIAGYSKPKE